MPSLPARLDAKSVRVVAQSLPGLVGPSGAVREDVADALASDAEVALRALVADARTFMCHGRRTSMIAEDMRSALRLRGGASAGAGLGHVEGRGFVSVAPGLFVREEGVVRVCKKSLEEAGEAEAGTRIGVDWMSVGGGVAPGRLDGILAALRLALDGAEDDLCAVLAHISTTRGVRALMPALLSQLHVSVARNMCSGGKVSTLSASTRVVRALLANPHFGLEAYVGNVVPLLLTISAGRVMGGGLSTTDEASIRGEAAQALGDLLRACGNQVLVTRCAKTFVAAMSSDVASLRVVHGAFLGLAALGKCVVEVALLPFIPGLLVGLKAITAEVEAAETVVAETEEYARKKPTLLHTTSEEARALVRAVERVMEVYVEAGKTPEGGKQSSDLMVLN